MNTPWKSLLAALCLATLPLPASRKDRMKIKLLLYVAAVRIKTITMPRKINTRPLGMM